MEAPWVVEFFESAAGRPMLLDEVEALMTARQLAKFQDSITKAAYKGKRGDILRAMIQTAEQRLKD